MYFTLTELRFIALFDANLSFYGSVLNRVGKS